MYQEYLMFLAGADYRVILIPDIAFCPGTTKVNDWSLGSLFAATEFLYSGFFLTMQDHSVQYSWDCT